MKIALFVDDNIHLGGACEHMLKQAKVLEQMRQEYIVVIPKPREDAIDLTVVERCKFYGLQYDLLEYHTANMFEYVDIDYAISCYEMIYKFLKRNEVNLIHYVQINVGVEMVARHLGIPTIMSIYSMPEHMFKVHYKNVMSPYLHTDSYWCIELWSTYYKFHSFCIRGYSEKNLLKNEKGELIRMVMSGSVVEFKNQLEAIKMIALLKAENINVQLTICGAYNPEDSYYKCCKAYVHEQQLENLVIFKGFVKNIYEVLGGMDLFLCASTRESFPQSIVEAIAMGLPIISTPVSGIPEVIRDGYNGFLSTDYTATSLVDVLKKYLSYVQDGRINQIMRNMEETYNEEFSFQAVRTRLLDMYEHVINFYTPQKDLLQEISSINREMETGLNCDIMNECDRQYVKWKKYWLYNIFRHFADKYSGKKLRIAIWGAGGSGQRALRIVQSYLEQVKVEYFVDEYKQGTVGDYSIYGKEQLIVQKIDLVIVATEPGKKFAIKWLEDNHMQYNEDYICML